MLVGVFKSNQKLVNGLVILFTVLLWIPAFFIERDTATASFISSGFLWLDIIIAIILISIQAIYLNIIVNEYKLVENNSHLTSLIFVLFNSCFIKLFSLNQVVIANTFILLGVHQLLRVYDTKGGFALSFNAGFLISIATVIYLPNGVLLLFLWFGLIYMISPKWRDFIITLIGFSIPVIYVVCYSYFFGDLEGFKWTDYIKEVFNLRWSEFSVLLKVLFFVILSVIILSFMRITSFMNKGALRTRKMLVVIIIMTVFGFGTLLLNKVDYLATFVLLTIPISIVVANFFQNIKKKWLSELLFITLLGLIISNYFL
jgi:hypothetical protein